MRSTLEIPEGCQLAADNGPHRLQEAPPSPAQLLNDEVHPTAAHTGRALRPVEPRGELCFHVPRGTQPSPLLAADGALRHVDRDDDTGDVGSHGNVTGVGGAVCVRFCLDKQTI